MNYLNVFDHLFSLFGAFVERNGQLWTYWSSSIIYGGGMFKVSFNLVASIIITKQDKPKNTAIDMSSFEQKLTMVGTAA